VSLFVESLGNFVETQKIAYERQVLAVPGLAGLSERTRHNVAEFADITHVDAPRTGIDRQRPAQGTVLLFLRRQHAYEVLVEERGDDEGVVLKSRILDDRVNPCLIREVGNIVLAAADCFDIWMTCLPILVPAEVRENLMEGVLDMPMQRYKPEQIVTVLRQVEVAVASGKTNPQACKEAGITVQTYYRWRKEYGGLKIEQAKRMKELEKENTRLKRLVAELSLEKQILKDVAEGNF
jgi:putative transposase